MRTKRIGTLLLLASALGLPAATLNNLYFGLDNMRGFAEVYWWFLSDGRVLHGLPASGLTPADFENTCKQNLSGCGTYTLAGDKLSIKYRGGQTEQWSFKTLNGGIQLNYIILSPVQKFPAGARLNGNYSRPYSATVGSVAITSPTFLSFKPDGTFAERNVTGVESTHPGGGLVSSGQTQSGGTYSIQDNVLLLNRNGKSERHLIFPAPGDNLNIDGRVYTRQK